MYSPPYLCTFVTKPDIGGVNCIKVSVDTVISAIPASECSLLVPARKMFVKTAREKCFNLYTRDCHPLRRTSVNCLGQSSESSQETKQNYFAFSYSVFYVTLFNYLSIDDPSLAVCKILSL